MEKFSVFVLFCFAGKGLRTTDIAYEFKFTSAYEELFWGVFVKSTDFITYGP